MIKKIGNFLSEKEGGKLENELEELMGAMRLNSNSSDRILIAQILIG